MLSILLNSDGAMPKHGHQTKPQQYQVCSLLERKVPELLVSLSSVDFPASFEICASCRNIWENIGGGWPAPRERRWAREPKSKTAHSTLFSPHCHVGFLFFLLHPAASASASASASCRLHPNNNITTSSTHHHQHITNNTTPSTYHHQHNITNTTPTTRHHPHNTINTTLSTQHHQHKHHQHNTINTTPTTHHHPHGIINTTPSTQDHLHLQHLSVIWRGRCSTWSTSSWFCVASAALPSQVQHLDHLEHRMTYDMI